MCNVYFRNELHTGCRRVLMPFSIRVTSCWYELVVIFTCRLCIDIAMSNQHVVLFCEYSDNRYFRQSITALLRSHLYLIWITSFESTWFTWFPHNIFQILPRYFFSPECKFIWFLLHNWNYQLLGIMLNYFGWLLWGERDWKEKKMITKKKKKRTKEQNYIIKKNQMKSNKSEFGDERGKKWRKKSPCNPN